VAEQDTITEREISKIATSIGQNAKDGFAISFVTNLVSSLVSFKPVWSVAKQVARDKLKKTLEPQGIIWDEEIKKIMEDGGDWEDRVQAVTDPQTEMPKYYSRTFHGYDDGNLCLQAALEQELAFIAIAMRDIPGCGLESIRVLRESYKRFLRSLYGLPSNTGSESREQLHPPAPLPRKIVDLGCGTGMSTYSVHEVLPDVPIIGVDLSPHFLAMANYRLEREWEPQPPITFKNGDITQTRLPDASCDLVTLMYVCHELPSNIQPLVLAEAYRILSPGGHIFFCDQNPSAEPYAKMSPIAFSVFRSTEPYLAEYFRFDMENAFTAAGFVKTEHLLANARHHVYIGRKP